MWDKLKEKKQVVNYTIAAVVFFSFLFAVSNIYFLKTGDNLSGLVIVLIPIVIMFIFFIKKISGDSVED